MTQHAIEGILQFQEGILPEPPGPNQRRVRVAIIDTGVNGEHLFIQRKTEIPGVSFKDFMNGSDESLTPIDISGHGTFIAGLILRLAPEATVFSARVGLDSTSIGRHEQAYMRVAEARNSTSY